MASGTDTGPGGGEVTRPGNLLGAKWPRGSLCQVAFQEENGALGT